VPPYLRDLILSVTLSVTAGYTANVSPGTHLRLVTSLLSLWASGSLPRSEL
jgi:hypothetical protein